MQTQPTRTIDAGLTVLATVTNKRTGTRHIAVDEFAKPACGAQPHSQRHSVSPMPGEFPDDFGDGRQDCAACAAMNAADYVVEETEFEYQEDK